LRIGIDVDGVLANFFKAYEELTIETTGKDLFLDKKWPAQLPQTWNWPETFGYTKEDMNRVWGEIKKSRNFWWNLEPIDDVFSFIQTLGEKTLPTGEHYFITDRPGVEPQDQTAWWLSKQGPNPNPAVIISGPHARKGQICAGLAITHYLDDKGENILDVLEKSPGTVAVLLAYPYNREFQEEIIINGGKVIQKREEFFDLL
jgi:hypothetical protein